MLTGLFEGNTPSDLGAAETWLGSKVGAVTAFTGQANWSDYVGSVGYEQGLWAGTGKTVLWSIPLFANGGNLHDAGQGAYDSYFKQVAQQLSSGQSSGPIYVRTGWEFNGAWETWAAQSNPADYIAAFRDFVNAFRSVSNRFVFTWAPNIGDQGMNPAAAYPGDKYVDIVGMDVYQQYSGQTFSDVQNETYGLNWLTSFAAAHGKPVAIPEWGVNTDTSGAYVTQAVAWMAANNLAYESYWDSNSGYAGKLSNGQNADTGAAFIQAFQTPHVTSVTAAVAAAGPANTVVRHNATTSGPTTLLTGQGATISVQFDKAVKVTGTPVLVLSDGEVATYSGTSSSGALTFSYVAGAGHSASDLQVTGLSLPAGAAITDSLGNAVSSQITGDLQLAVTLNITKNTTLGPVAGDGVISLGSATLTISGTGADAAAHTTFSGAIQGSGSLVFAGSDVAAAHGNGGATQIETLSHASTYTGGTTLTGGTLELAAAGAAGSGAITFADSSRTVHGVLQIDNAALSGAGTALESVSNKIKGMVGPDIIDLTGLSFNSAPAAQEAFMVGPKGGLVITESGVSVAFATNLTPGTVVHAFEDSHGGTYFSSEAMISHDASVYHP